MNNPYDSIAEKLSRRYLRRHHPLDLSRFQAEIESDLPVLDAGCGVGLDTEDLRIHGFDSIGLDASPKMISIARRQFRSNFLVGDVLSLPFKSESFSGVWCMSVLSLFDAAERRLALENLARVLLKGGILFVAIWHGVGTRLSDEVVPNVPRVHYLAEPEDWQRGLLAAGLEPYRSIIEVIEHEGREALKLFARKA